MAEPAPSSGGRPSRASTKQVRAHIENITRRAAKDAGADPRGESRKELASHLFDLANNRALGRTLTIQDVDAAWVELAPKAIYLLREEPVQTKAAVAPAASWVRRFAAYVADLATIVGSLVVGTVVFGEYLARIDEIAIVVFIFLLMTMHLILTGLEVRRGATPGKMLLNLRTIDANGSAPSWPGAWLITLPKLLPPLLVLDVLVGILTGIRDRVRATERMVGLRVTKVN